jgi:hypothetical protein
MAAKHAAFTLFVRCRFSGCVTLQAMQHAGMLGSKVHLHKVLHSRTVLLAYGVRGWRFDSHWQCCFV